LPPPSASDFCVPDEFDEKRGRHPRFFVAPHYLNDDAAHRLIVAIAGIVVETIMVPDQTSAALGIISRIVIDDRSRLPGRFFGRFTTSATSGLTRAL
jgi:hypothetical protein